MVENFCLNEWGKDCNGHINQLKVIQFKFTSCNVKVIWAVSFSQKDDKGIATRIEVCGCEGRMGCPPKWYVLAIHGCCDTNLLFAWILIEAEKKSESIWKV